MAKPKGEPPEPPVERDVHTSSAPTFGWVVKKSPDGKFTAAKKAAKKAPKGKKKG